MILCTVTRTTASAWQLNPNFCVLWRYVSSVFRLFPQKELNKFLTTRILYLLQMIDCSICAALWFYMLQASFSYFSWQCCTLHWCCFYSRHMCQNIWFWARLSCSKLTFFICYSLLLSKWVYVSWLAILNGRERCNFLAYSHACLWTFVLRDINWVLHSHLILFYSHLTLGSHQWELHAQ